MNNIIRTNKFNWVSAHIFYSEPWEYFITNCIVNLIQELKKKEDIHFFFIRYWEKGAHIRLRIKTADISRTQKMIVEYSSDYFSKYPSQRSNFDICNPDLYPNNTVQFIKYQPETERYGGPIGINIAEKQFEISSEAVIRLLQQYPTISYEGRLFAAIQLHLGFVYSFGFTKEEIYSFFHTIEQMMLMHVLNLSSSTDKRTEQEKKILAAFVNSYEKQSAMLINYSGDIWNALHKNMKFDSPWMEYWTNNLKHIHEALSSAFLKGLILPDKYQRPNKLWYIYESYIHMTNNRLGILNCDEAYLAYLICRVIKEI